MKFRCDPFLLGQKLFKFKTEPKYLKSDFFMDPIESKQIVIVFAEDDEDDYVLASEAFKDAGIDNELIWVKNGEELLHFLKSNLEKKVPAKKRIGLILLDLNMPKKDGFESLKEIKDHPHLRQIPTIILTTSKSESDILKVYELGGNSFIQKPSKFSEYMKTIEALHDYWLQIVRLPY